LEVSLLITIHFTRQLSHGLETGICLVTCIDS